MGTWAYRPKADQWVCTNCKEPFANVYGRMNYCPTCGDRKYGDYTSETKEIDVAIGEIIKKEILRGAKPSSTVDTIFDIVASLLKIYYEEHELPVDFNYEVFLRGE